MQMLKTGDPITGRDEDRLGIAKGDCRRSELMETARLIAAKITLHSPAPVPPVKRAVRLGARHPLEQAIAVLMDAHWRSAVHPLPIARLGPFVDHRQPTFQDSVF